MDQPKAQEQHRWLRRLVGQWTYEHEGLSGTETVRAVGDLWILAEGSGKMPDGAPATTIMTLGYDPDRLRFTGTFIGSMMTHLWVYEGALDESGKVLTLNTAGPAMSGSGLASYRDIVEIVDENNRTLTSYMLGVDGAWSQIMKAAYRRTL